MIETKGFKALNKWSKRFIKSFVGGGTDCASVFDYCDVVAPIVDASSVGTIEGAAAAFTMTVLVVVAVLPNWSAAT